MGVIACRLAVPILRDRFISEKSRPRQSSRRRGKNIRCVPKNLAHVDRILSSCCSVNNRGHAMVRAKQKERCRCRYFPSATLPATRTVQSRVANSLLEQRENVAVP